MNDFNEYQKSIVRELSCRLCLCTDVVKLKPLSNELKRKLQKLFNIQVRIDDNLPKAICHDCLQQIGSIHRYSIKVEKTQNFLDHYKNKNNDNVVLLPNSISAVTDIDKSDKENKIEDNEKNTSSEGHIPKSPPRHEHDAISKATIKYLTNAKPKIVRSKRKPQGNLKHREAMPLDEFMKTEGIEQSMLSNLSAVPSYWINNVRKPKADKQIEDSTYDVLDPIVLIDGKPAKQGAALDRQISLFYKMECNICHEKGFNYKSLMKHYKDKHGVPGYVMCCDKKFHYFYPKKILEHMAYHLQPNVFMCPSCHENFQSSQELQEHKFHGGKSDGKIVCPRCAERFPTWRELGCHLIRHRVDQPQCDYCAKLLRHHHRKKTVNGMEDVMMCSHCTKALRAIEKGKADTVKFLNDPLICPNNQTGNSESPLVTNTKHTRRPMLAQSDGDNLQE